MKIEGNGLTELCEINLKLHSTDMKFQCQFCRSLESLMFNHNAVACIEFKDSYEIDQLIDILQRFKNENCQQLGTWS